MPKAKTNGHFETTIPLKFDRSTKNTHLYRAPEGSAVESVYIQQSAMGKEPPETLTLIVRE